MYHRVSWDRSNGHTTVSVLTLNRPEKLNPMTAEMSDAMTKATDELAQLPAAELRAVVLTGAGRAFSAGGDMRFLNDRMNDTPTGNAEAMIAFYKRYLCIRKLPVPIVACINGPAIGAGLCFAMGADIKITCDTPRLGFTFVGLGLHPGMGATHTIAAACGQVASQLLLTGDVLKGGEAQAIGLVCQSLPDADAALEASVATARRIAAQSPLAVRATVKTLRASSDAGLEAALVREADAQAQSYASADFAEGLQALAEKRAPCFPGR
eukprot:6082123-Prymnesium_polylepis.1